MKNLPTLFQRLESTVLFAVAIWIYQSGHYSWLVFALLLFSFDIFMLGYLINARIGAVVYNIGHNYASPVLFFIFSVAWFPKLSFIVLIWLAHIAMDRALGYGLKFVTSFQDTHLGRIGKN